MNKVALLRNSRGGNIPDLLAFVRACEQYGAEGITVHPRPDERHIRYEDVRNLRAIVTTELNVEGFPSDRWMELVLEVRPEQATLVPDRPDQLTSDHGWDTIRERTFLQDILRTLQRAGIRVSIFVDPDPRMVEGAASLGADRVELYTGPYAREYPKNIHKAIEPYLLPAQVAFQSGVRLNAGHDLNLQNLAFLRRQIPWLEEVSIGHALISDALYLGIERTIHEYRRRLQIPEEWRHALIPGNPPPR